MAVYLNVPWFKTAGHVSYSLKNNTKVWGKIICHRIVRAQFTHRSLIANIKGGKGGVVGEKHRIFKQLSITIFSSGSQDHGAWKRQARDRRYSCKLLRVELGTCAGKRLCFSLYPPIRQLTTCNPASAGYRIQVVLLLVKTSTAMG